MIAWWGHGRLLLTEWWWSELSPWLPPFRLLLLLLPLVARNKLCRRRLQLAIWISNKLLPSPLDLLAAMPTTYLLHTESQRENFSLTVCNALMYNTELERQIAASKNSFLAVSQQIQARWESNTGAHQSKHNQATRCSKKLVHTKALWFF